LAVGDVIVTEMLLIQLQSVVEWNLLSLNKLEIWHNIDTH